MITKTNQTFHLQGKNISYIMRLSEDGDLLQYHFGKKLAVRDYALYPMDQGPAWLAEDDRKICLENQLQEYPSYGHLDLRLPAYTVQNRYQNRISHLVYEDSVILENQVAFVKGMPSLFLGNKQAQTLEITLSDKAIGLQVILSYTVFDEYDVILRSSRIINGSAEPMMLTRAYSASLDFSKRDMDMIYFPGAWAKERELVRTPIRYGSKVEASNARGASGHAMNPFVMLCDPTANEKQGNVYGFSLIYSGNHSTVAECDQYGNIRVMQGINPFDFEYRLSSGETFDTPQSVLCYSDSGLGGLSREMHQVYRNQLCKSQWAHKDRPVIINNWEGTYFNFTEEKLLAMAKQAKAVGIELFVLDDGWYGKRNDETSSLGDWVANPQKLPSGIRNFAEKINGEGLAFGLWFEPEMVSPDSDLYRNHPDWAVAVPNCKPSLGKCQLVLDLSNNEVCDYIIDSLSNILGSANIAYVKWDHNRVMSDMPYPGYNHQYTLGLYRVLDALTARFPEILFEGCAAGGGRFDPGILAYSPQIWASDNSDAVSRLKIQYATSMCYPISTISAHVTASPNHQVGRCTSLKTRAEVAYAGVFGYELDITKMSEEDWNTMSEQIRFYRTIRTLVRTGDFYRLQNPFDSNYCSWQIVSNDKKRTLVFSCRILNCANTKETALLLEGLDGTLEYVDTDTDTRYGGDELMYHGITPQYANTDFATFIKVYEAR